VTSSSVENSEKKRAEKESNTSIKIDQTCLESSCVEVELCVHLGCKVWILIIQESCFKT
jgi:exosome complex RNA-binding protein Rrp42 (RNase PH superfamily)